MTSTATWPIETAASKPPRSRRHPAARLLPTLLALALVCLACAMLAVGVQEQLGAAAFAVFVVALAMLRPNLVFVLAMLLAPFPNDIQTGLPVKVAASDLCLFIALPFVIARRGPHFVRAFRAPYWLPLAAYLGLCVLSTVMNGFDQEAVISTSQMFVYMVFTVLMFAAGSGSADELLPRLYTVPMVGLILAFAICLGGSNYVFGIHKNSAGSTLGASVMIVLALLFAEAEQGGIRKPTLVLLLLLSTGLLASLSRGAWIGAAAGSMVIMTMYGRVSLALRLGLACLPLMAILWLILPEGQKEYATDLSSSAHNVQARLKMIDYALSRFRESPIIGVGVGLRKTYDSTNLALSTLAESGVVGLTTFVAIYVTLAYMSFVAARRMDRRDPAFALLALGTALVLAKLLHGLVDHYWSRGAIMYWAGAGFVVAGYVNRKSPTRERPSRPASGTVDAPRI